MTPAGTEQQTKTTRTQRRKQAARPTSAADVPAQDGTLADAEIEVEPDVVEHTLVGADSLEAGTPLADEIAENDGLTVERAIDFGGDPELRDRIDAPHEEAYFEEEPDPAKTVVKLNVGRFGKREVVLLHKVGCPGRPVRVESIPVVTPQGRRGIVTRCCDCGEDVHTRIT